MKWFGKGCRHQCCQWEGCEELDGPDYREAEPTLFFCNDLRNTDPHEGNCHPSQCPELRKEITDVNQQEK